MNNIIFYFLPMCSLGSSLFEMNFLRTSWGLNNNFKTSLFFYHLFNWVFFNSLSKVSENFFCFRTFHQPEYFSTTFLEQKNFLRHVCCSIKSKTPEYLQIVIKNLKNFLLVIILFLMARSHPGNYFMKNSNNFYFFLLLNFIFW